MKLKDTENLLRGLKGDHLTEDEVDFYYHKRLDPLGQKLADAHLRQCLICQVRVENRKITAEDVAMVKRAMQEWRQEQAGSTTARARPRPSPGRRLSDYLQQIMEGWKAAFRQQEAVRSASMEYEAVRSASHTVNIIWKGKSEDGVLRAYAILEDDASLTIHFSSDDPSLEGLSFNVSLGSVSRDITLELTSGSEVHAKVEVARNRLPVSLAAINIRPIS